MQGWFSISAAVLTPSQNRESRLSTLTHSQPLFLQFDRQGRRLAAGDSDGLFDGCREGLYGYQLVSPRRHICDAEFAIGVGQREVRVVNYVDPSLHPAMRVAIYPHGAGARQFCGD